MEQLHCSQDGVALVEVVHGWVDAQSAQGACPAESEHRVLGEADLAVALVEARGDPASDGGVGLHVAVEQVERYAPYVDAPDLDREVFVAKRNCHHKRASIVAGHEHARCSLRVDVDPVLVLHAFRVDPLVEVPAPIHQADAHHRQGQVGCALEDVAREDAEPTRVDREGLVQTELRAQERGRPGVGHCAGPRWS